MCASPTGNVLERDKSVQANMMVDAVEVGGSTACKTTLQCRDPLVGIFIC
jgi:hypothetical protein